MRCGKRAADEAPSLETIQPTSYTEEKKHYDNLYIKPNDKREMGASFEWQTLNIKHQILKIY